MLLCGSGPFGMGCKEPVDYPLQQKTKYFSLKNPEKNLPSVSFLSPDTLDESIFIFKKTNRRVDVESCRALCRRILTIKRGENHFFDLH